MKTTIYGQGKGKDEIQLYRDFKGNKFYGNLNEAKEHFSKIHKSILVTTKRKC